ncbi:MAG: sigma-70 family RNA polymerase sigma factor [Ktedonobacterales bacterium]
MEPPTRLYNSNAGEPRKRQTRTNRRASASEPAKMAPVARRAPVSEPLTPDLVETEAQAHPTGAPEAADVVPLAPARLGASADRADRAEDVAAPAEAGPVVGIEDFEEIFTRFQTPLTNFVYRLVGNREQAYDLTQDVFVKAYRALSSGTTIQAAALSSWLYRIASNTATDSLRRRRLISWLPLSLFNEDRGVGAGMPGSETPGQQQTYAEEALASAAGTFMSSYDGGRFEQRVADREVVEAVLRRLPPKYATCLLLYEHEGFSCAEIAEVLNVSPSAVKMRLMRARERFITLYKQEMDGQE